MGKQDIPPVSFRKAERSLVGVQRHLSNASHNLAVWGVDCDDLLAECVALKERVIQRFQECGGRWEDFEKTHE